MRQAPPTFTLFLLTEDSGADAPEVLRRLAEKMYFLANPLGRAADLRFEPTGPNERRPMNFNGWIGDRKKRVDLAQSIVTRLLRAPPHLVIFHIDGDLPWSRSEGGRRGPRLDAYERLLRPVLTDLLRSRSAEESLKRLVLIVPYYNIEAWIFQNLEEARALYRKHHPGGHPAVPQLDHYQADRADLEEATDLKERFRLLSQHRLHLVTAAWPSKRALEVGRSFAASVECLRWCLEGLQGSKD